MEFEFDRRKSEANLLKHGIDFDEIQELWLGVVVSVGVEFKRERRFLGMGKLAGEHWTVVYARREGRIRIISARRSTAKERSYYDRASFSQ